MTTALALRNQDLILAGPVGDLDAYIQAVGAVPVLSKEDEQALAMRFREDDDRPRPRTRHGAPALRRPYREEATPVMASPVTRSRKATSAS